MGYPAFLYVGLAAGLWVADALARRSGLNAGALLAALLILLPPALLGMRATYVLLHWRRFRTHPAEVFAVQRGGASSFGAVVPALLVSIPLLPRLGLPFGAFWDVATMAVLASVIFSRGGCLLAGCCPGRACNGPLAWRLPAADGTARRRIPFPILDAALSAGWLLAGWLTWEDRPFQGAFALLGAGGYAAGRFLLEWLRAGRRRVLAGLGASQWIALALSMACASGLVTDGFGLEPAAPAAVLPAANADALRLALAGVLLLPIVRLFRFVGCQLIVEPNIGVPDGPRQAVRLGVVVPDPGGEVEVEFRFDLEGYGEIDPSPLSVGLVYELSAPDGRLAFGTTESLPEGPYEIRCTVFQDGEMIRESQCTGEVNATDQALVFEAPPGDATGMLDPKFCFEQPALQSVRLAAVVADTGGTGPFDAKIVLEELFNVGPTEIGLDPIGPVGLLEGFEKLFDAPEGFYRAICTVERTGITTRIGICAGELDAPGEETIFRARDTDPPGEILPISCFEAP